MAFLNADLSTPTRKKPSPKGFANASQGNGLLGGVRDLGGKMGEGLTLNKSSTVLPKSGGGAPDRMALPTKATEATGGGLFNNRISIPKQPRRPEFRGDQDNILSDVAQGVNNWWQNNIFRRPTNDGYDPNPDLARGDFDDKPSGRDIFKGTEGGIGKKIGESIENWKDTKGSHGYDRFEPVLEDIEADLRGTVYDRMDADPFAANRGKSLGLEPGQDSSVQLGRGGIDDFEANTARVGNTLDQYLWDKAANGPLGSRYSGQEQEIMDRLSQMGGEGAADTLGGNVKKFFGDVGVDERSQLELDLDQMYRDAVAGNLTEADNKAYQAQSKLFDTAAQDALQDVREQYGAMRGIGGGKYNEAMGKVAENLGNQKMALLADLQRGKADQAANFLNQTTQNKNQLKQIAANLGTNLSGTNLQATGQMADFIQGNAKIAESQAATALNQDRLKLDKEMAAMKSKMSQGQYEMEYDQRERQLQEQNFMNYVKQIQDGAMDRAELLQADKRGDIADKETPGGKLEGLLGGLTKAGQLFGLIGG